MVQTGKKPKWGLNVFRPLRNSIVTAKWLYYTKFWGMDIDPTASFSLSVRFDKTNPKGLHIGAETYVAFEAAILTHAIRTEPAAAVFPEPRRAHQAAALVAQSSQAEGTR